MTFPRDHKEMFNYGFRDVDGQKTKYAVEVENSQSNPVPVVIVIGDSKNLFAETNTSAGTEVTVISYTVTETLFNINLISLSCIIQGVAFLYINSNKVNACRISAGNPNSSMTYLNPLKLSNGDLVEVKFKARNNSPISEVEASINASITT